MPSYEYGCEEHGSIVIRRSFSEMDVETFCPTCSRLMARQFTTTSNIHVPIAFKAVGTGGQPGGYSWSDFHTRTEKELAHMKDFHGERVEVLPASEARSLPGFGRKADVNDYAERATPALDKALDKALTKVNTIDQFGGGKR